MTWITSAIVAVGFAAVVLSIAWAFAPKGWRTIVANALSGFAITVVPLAQPIFDQLTVVAWNDVFDATTAVFITVAVNVMNIWLRKITTTPMGEA